MLLHQRRGQRLWVLPLQQLHLHRMKSRLLRLGQTSEIVCMRECLLFCVRALCTHESIYLLMDDCEHTCTHVCAQVHNLDAHMHVTIVNMMRPHVGTKYHAAIQAKHRVAPYHGMQTYSHTSTCSFNLSLRVLTPSPPPISFCACLRGSTCPKDRCSATSAASATGEREATSGGSTGAASKNRCRRRSSRSSGGRCGLDRGYFAAGAACAATEGEPARRRRHGRAGTSRSLAFCRCRACTGPESERFWCGRCRGRVRLGGGGPK